MEETTRSYKGSLDVLYQHPYVQKYLKNNVIAYGYLGHELRTSETDSFLESTLDLANNQAKYEELYNVLAEWICSRNARHLMDDYGHLNQNDLSNCITASIFRYYVSDYKSKSPLLDLFVKAKEMLL